MSERKVYVFLEIPAYIETTDETNVYLTSNNNDVAADILRNYSFRSDKSLVDFLEKNREYILNAIPIDEEKLCLLEKQDFLGYLHVKWYQQKESDNFSVKVTPSEILDLALIYKGVTQKEILNYILDNREEYLYEIHQSTLKV